MLNLLVPVHRPFGPTHTTLRNDLLQLASQVRNQQLLTAYYRITHIQMAMDSGGLLPYLPLK